MSLRRVAASIAAASLVIAACGEARPASNIASTASSAATTSTENDTVERSAIEFVGADSVTSTIDDPSRIVTLSGDLTEIVFALGLGDSVVATDVTTVHPPEAIGLPIIGVGRFLTAEGVLSQNPSLVLGDTQTSPQTAIDQIRSAGVPVVITEAPTSFAALYEKTRQIGAVLDVSDKGQRLAEQIEAEVAAALAPAAEPTDRPRVAFVYSRGPDVMLLFGSGMSTQPVIEAVGGTDAGAASGVSGTVAVTPEALVAAAPDVIVTTQEGLDALGGVDAFLLIPGVAETPAGRNQRILAYPEGDVLTFGPRIAESLGLFIDDMRTVLDS